MNVKISVTQVCDYECPRKIPLTIYSTKVGFKKKFDLNAKAFAGNILHFVLQETFIRKFSYVEYFFPREKSAVEAIYCAFDVILKNLVDFYSLEPYFNKNQEIIDEGFKIAEEKLWNLANLSTTLIEEKNDRIISKVLKDEFSVFSMLNKNVLLTGKVDLIAIEKDHLRIIELKTGNIYEKDRNQSQIYGELMKQSFPTQQFKLEIWYTDPDRSSWQIVPVTISDHSNLLKNVNTQIDIASSIETESSLPPKTSQTFRCRFCKLCFESNLRQIFPSAADKKTQKLGNFF
ncbi:MAG: PD-(D/E)XK nuclease family protein [Candidatus Odinarchaeota archaeon]